MDREKPLVSPSLFPATINTSVISWVLMVGLPLAMLFLVLDRWQWHLTR